MDESSQGLMSEQDDTRFYTPEKKSMSLPNVPFDGDSEVLSCKPDFFGNIKFSCISMLV